ncbi:MAG TPA: hypothetical protein VEF06_01010 [Bryobacteraceae bacterium]|nr:hypothetical protein [Bryobacteraceae bacterium]
MTALPLAAQNAKPGAVTKADASWKAPRTEYGQPDLTGIWTNNVATPLERPKDLAGKEFFTEEEAAAYEKMIRSRPDSNADVVSDTEVWWEKGKSIVTTHRTSLIVDPPDGRMPPLTPEAQKRMADIRADQRKHPDSGPEDFGLQSRCIVWPAAGPLPMLPAPYNNDYQIYQTKDYVVIEIEMIHDTRIIPLDGSPHLPSNVEQWLGDSRGHWEGDTLVVETTNFTDKTRFRGSDEKLRLVERFTRTAPDVLTYQFTLDDPSAFTKPWTAEVPMVATPGPLYEFACHEGNEAIPNMLKTARTAEKKAAEKAAGK